MKHLLIIIALLVLCSISLRADHGGDIEFIQNQGQWSQQVQYKAPLLHGALFLEESTFTYSFLSAKDLAYAHDLRHGSLSDQKKVHRLQIRGHAYQVKFLNALSATLTGGDLQLKYHNYFLGSDRSKWAGNIPVYNEVQYNMLYPGVNMRTYSSKGNIKYDFHIKEGADPGQIKLSYEGVDQLKLDESGNLHVATSVNEVVEEKPYAYQMVDGMKISIPCNYVLRGNQLSFEFPEGYDESMALVIDPAVIASTLSGSVSWNGGHSATYDEDGNIYTGAIAWEVGYPTTPGAFQTSFGGMVDIAISKLNPDGSQLIFATHIGGAKEDYPHSIVVSQDQEIYIYGSTSSSDYPVTPGAVDTSANNPPDDVLNRKDIIVTVLNEFGSALIGSTYMGGDNTDGNNSMVSNFADQYRGEIIIDEVGNCYVASFTSSDNFPTTLNSYQSVRGGSQDAVLFSLNKDMSLLHWSTYLGGMGPDAAFGLRLGPDSSLYVAGATSNSKFPIPGSAYDSTFGGTIDGYVIKFNYDGTAVLAGTYFGGLSKDQIFFIDLDSDGNVYVYGQSLHGNVPITPGTYGNPGSNQFICKFSPNLDSLIFSTAIGSGNGGVTYDFAPIAFMVNNCGHIFASGHGGLALANGSYITVGVPPGIPTTPNALQTEGGFYLLALERDAKELLFATYYGGPFDHVDGGTSRFDKNGLIYQAVCTDSGFVTTTDAWSSTYPGPGKWDIGVFKMDFQIDVRAIAAPSPIGCAPLNVDFINTSVGNDYFWDFGDGSVIDSSFNPSHTFVDPGEYDVVLISIDSASCSITDTTSLHIIASKDEPVAASFIIKKGEDDCDTEVSLENTSLGTRMRYTWNLGDGFVHSDSNVIHTYQSAGEFQISLFVEDTICPTTDIALGDISIVDCCTRNIIVPNVFSPNDDGINDQLQIFLEQHNKYTLHILNRWGKILFTSTELASMWDGRFEDQEVNEGVYFYHLTVDCDLSNETVIRKGHVMVLR